MSDYNENEILVAVSEKVTSANEKIPLKEKILYGSGDFYGGGSAVLISLLLLAFLNKSLGISAAVASTIIMISKGWDAISDPLMGVISDNARTKWGRRKPFIFLGAILTFISMLLLFAPIADMSLAFKIAFSGFAYLFFCTANTVSQVPFMSLSSDISPDYKERNKANFIKLLFSMAGAAVCYLIPSLVLEAMLDQRISGLQFFLIIGVGFGLIFAFPLMLTSIYSKERTPYNPDIKVSFSFKSYSEPFKIKSFVWHIIMYLSVFLCTDIISALAVYYSADVLRDMQVLGNPMSMLYIVGPMMVFAGIMVFVAMKVSKKFSKQFALRIGIPLYIFSGLFLTFFPADGPGILVPIVASCMGIGLGGAQCMPWIIFPDTIDVAEFKTGKRVTGSFSGIMTFSRKMATAIAIWIVGMFLTLSGQIPGIEGQSQPIQPDKVLLTIRILMGVSVVVLMSIAYYASKHYKVTDKKLDRIKYFLEYQRENRLFELSEKENIERQELLDELANW